MVPDPLGGEGDFRMRLLFPPCGTSDGRWQNTRAGAIDPQHRGLVSSPWISPRLSGWRHNRRPLDPNSSMGYSTCISTKHGVGISSECDGEVLTIGVCNACAGRVFYRGSVVSTSTRGTRDDETED